MCRFIKFIPSEETMYLVRKHLKAFGLLTIIAKRARRENGHPDGLSLGQCHLGDHKYYGLTEKEYRNAKKVLVDRGHIKIIETCRTRKNKKCSKSTLHDKNGATERATKSTTIGTLVELCSTTVYDINLDESKQQKGDRKGDRRATEGRPKGDEQEREERKKEKNNHHPPTPSLIDDDDLSSKVEIIPGVVISQKDLDSCVKLKGSIEKVKQTVEFIQSNPKRAHEITDWPGAMVSWKIPNTLKVSIEKNMALAARLYKQFEHFDQGKGWRCRNYHDRVKDQTGILFECNSPHEKAVFIGYSDCKFEQKCQQTVKDKIVGM